MPIDAARPTNRRASSPKRESDVATGRRGPVITQTAYNNLVRGQGGTENLQVKRLAQVRNLLGQAMLLSKALTQHYQHAGNKAMRAACRKVEQDVEKGYLGVPLEVVNR